MTTTVTTTLPTELEIPAMPTWTDSTSVAVFLTAAVGSATAGLTLFDPSIVPQVTTLSHALIPSVAGLIAGGAVIVNVLRHAMVHKVAVTAATSVKVARVMKGTAA